MRLIVLVFGVLILLGLIVVGASWLIVHVRAAGGMPATESFTTLLWLPIQTTRPLRYWRLPSADKSRPCK